MSRWLIGLALGLGLGTAYADPPPTAVADIGEQAVGADVGAAAGSHITPGGLRVAGHYLYQLSDQDWFDGTASFTFGAGGAACFRDRANHFICEHGIADGRAVEIVAAVRRYFAPQGVFRPFARLGVGVGIASYPDDSVTGLTIPLHVGGGVRATVADGIAVVAQGELAVGFGAFGHSLGLQPQLGFAVVAGAEFRL